VQLASNYDGVIAKPQVSNYLYHTSGTLASTPALRYLRVCALQNSPHYRGLCHSGYKHIQLRDEVIQL
jgi:hypothetical protein